MSDGTISQDEIDALLSGVDMGGLSAGGGSSSSSDAKINTDILSKFAVDLKDKLAHNVGTMTGADTVVNTPVVESCNREAFLAKLPDSVVAVMADFSSGLAGDHLYVLSTDFAQKLTSLINKEENAELDDMALSVVAEVVAGHTGSEITELTKNGRFPGLACNPGESVNGPKAMVRFPQGEFALFSYPVVLDGAEYTLWEAIAGGAADQISSTLAGGGASAPVQNMSQPTMGGGMMNMGAMQAAPMNMNGMAMQAMGGGMNMGGMGNGFVSMPMGMSAPNVQSLQFPGLQGGVSSVEQGNIGLIMDVYMEMTVELGRTKKQIKEILGMGEGTIIELDKLAGEPVDILVNHKPIAKGEVVVIDENFGVRVTEILSPIERVTG
ncbi:MAG: flagellar motor switch protein FliN [Spirochaetaceae bacterium]|nr:flagellar motor switch protein FliN [Spirochaetaceae bacterium]MBQ8562191.1 flagellar motor switch protein FliN [Spirochaetaceae bacterium]MBR2361928.1 flagellar motor switch protein FliN [Spirochaetaceae bacterium]